MSVLLGQARHLLAGAGYVTAGAGAATDSLESLIGGIVIALLGHLLSWLNAKRAG